MEKFYTVALRKRTNNDRFLDYKDYTFTEAKIKKGKYWYADPFLFEKDGVTYLFYEAYDLIMRKGYIGYSIVNDDLTLTDPKIIIKERAHKSFPYIFEKDNQIYLMPESCADKSIKLYKAINFPNEWKKEEVLVSNIFGADTIFIDKNLLLTSEQYLHPNKDRIISCYVKNRIIELGGGYL